jgi:lipid-binding SYLF domain-containing protein
MKRIGMPLGALLLLALAAAPLRAGGRELSTLSSASEVVRAYGSLPLQGIPPALLHDARGVAVIPHVVKAGFLFGGRFGRGVVLARRPDGRWGEPVFVSLAGGGFGLQAGVQSTDVVLVFKTANSLNRILRGGNKITLGGDVSVAAGPAGRQAEAATDVQLRAEIFSYSRSRGLFAGVSLEGAALVPDAEANEAFHRGYGAQEAYAVECLKGWLDRMSALPVAPPVPIVVAPVQTPAPPLAPVPVPIPHP